MRALVLVLVVTSPFGRSLCAEDDLTARYFEGLRERHLFSLAEGYCLDRLANDELSAEQRARLVIELSRTFSEHGRFRPDDERDGLWSEAGRVLDEYLAGAPPAEQRLLAGLQRGLLPAGQGEFLLRQHEVVPFDLELKGDAEAKLDEAVRRLESSVAALAAARRAAFGGEGPAGALLALWSFNAELRLAVARLDRASLYEKGSPDRADLLNLAEERLKALAEGDPLEESTQRCQVLLARTLRLEGRVEQAVHPLEALLQRERPVSREIRDEIEGERAMILLSLNRPDEAVETLVAYRRERGRLPGELQLAMTRSLLGLWNAVRERDEALAAQALERVRTQVRAAEIEVGGYWGVRCRALLELAEEAAEMGPELAMVVRRADGRFRAGDVDGAITGYREAARSANESNRGDLAARLGFTLASMELEGGRFESAVADFRAVEERFPEDERAAKSGLLAAYALGRWYDAERTAARREAYVAALERHRRRFAGDATAAEATLMLARLQERRLQYTTAVELYLAVPIDHERGFEAAAGAARMFEAILARLRDFAPTTDEQRRELDGRIADWERSARSNLQRYVARFPPLLHPLDPSQARVAMTLARLLLVTDPLDFDTADALLERVTATWDAIEGEEVSNAERRTWTSLAREAAQLRIVALAGRGRIEAAQRLVEERAGSDPRVVLSVLDGLTGVLRDAGPDLVRQLGELQLAMAEPLVANKESLDPATRRRLDVCLVEAYFATQRSQQAVDTAREVLAASPRDAVLQRRLGKRLVECGRANCLEAALPIWRSLERGQPAGTPAWFEARYHVVLCTLRLGDREAARKLLGVTRTLHPGLGGSPWRERFAELITEVSSPDNNS